MDECPATPEASREERGVLVLRGKHHPDPLEVTKVLGEGEGDAGAAPALNTVLTG
jgi:hypothetical protein